MEQTTELQAFFRNLAEYAADNGPTWAHNHPPAPWVDVPGMPGYAARAELVGDDYYTDPTEQSEDCYGRVLWCRGDQRPPIFDGAARILRRSDCFAEALAAAQKEGTVQSDND